MHIAANTETVEIPKFDFVDFFSGTDSLFGLQIWNWVIYLIIFIGVSYIYNKVFRTRKLPILKSLIVYIILAMGSFLLLVFQYDANIPIVYSILVAIGLMLLVRIRYFVEERRENKVKKG
ncbi:YlaH-like family protein [Longirhabdus pacifica]|uniref:YlaH-like family protein n=1 Tax=Longirhabdus pacifica TaxID=2305227 RepID=UPI001008AE38|nr:YlaH-like family protein [Longirhabdus pacifica]